MFTTKFFSVFPCDLTVLIRNAGLKYPYRLAFKCFNKYSYFEDDSNIDDTVKEKVIFNTYCNVDLYRFKSGKFKKKKPFGKKNNPVFLKHLLECDEPTQETFIAKDSIYENEEITNLPFQFTVKDLIPENLNNNLPDDLKRQTEETLEEKPFYLENEIKKSQNWMNDYEVYSKEECLDNEWSINYGTPDPSVPISNVTCGGCGSLFQCKEPSIPGYLPSEIFCECKSQDLRSLLCQRCHFLKHYNTALSVQVDSNSYVSLLSQMKENALILLLVDLTDFPCSIWPGIVNIVGPRRPLFIIGNKIDLLWGDKKDWLKHVELVLRKSFPDRANILHLSLISAKTGFGVEDLVTKLHTVWKYKSDVYLLGCTNSGKSTLFNALLQSDYCKTKAVDLVQRATTAPWPGTTLNLLKFPILRPEGWRLYARDIRLSDQKRREKAERELQKLQYKKQRKETLYPIQLIGHIGHTFKELDRYKKECDFKDHFNLPNGLNKNPVRSQISLMNTNFLEFDRGKWFYDTPGVMHSEQVLDLLTTEELLLTLPKDMIRPRTFRFRLGWTLFISGLARVDYIKGTRPIRITVFSSMTLPITICKTEDATSVQESLLNSKYMNVPCGNVSRMARWPGLQAGAPIILNGVGENESCADIVLSSAGWVSVTPAKNEMCTFIPWTPMMRGIFMRTPSLLPFAVKLRGKKLRYCPSYSKTSPYFD